MSSREGTGSPSGFGVIWATVAIDQVGFGILIPVLALYAESFGASPATIGLLIATFSLSQLIVAPIGGRLSDRFGRKPLILFSLLGTAAGSLITGLAGAVWVLFLGRVVDGMSGASVTVSQAAVTDLAPSDQRAKLLARLGAAIGFGFAIGPAIGGLAAAVGGRRAPFFVAATLALVNAAVAWFRLPETHPRGGRPAGVDGDTDSGAARPRVEFHRRLVLLLVVALLASLAFSMMTTTLPLLLADRVGLDEGGVGMVFAVIGVGIIFCSALVVGPTVQWLGESNTVRLGLFLNAVGLALLVPDGAWLWIVPSFVLLTVGQSDINGPQSAFVANVTAPDVRGSVLGINQAAIGVGRVVGPVLGGVLFGRVGAGWPYLVAAIVTFGALLLVPRAGRGSVEALPDQVTAR